MDCVSFAFAQTANLQRSSVEPPTIHAVGQLRCPTYGVYEVPFRITDDRGTTRTCRRLCVAIDRDPRTEGSPILLSRTFLNEHRVILEPASDRWLFGLEIAKSELLTAPQFLDQARGSAHVYAVTMLPTLALPDEDEPVASQDLDSIPAELRSFLDVFSAQEANQVPDHKASDHAIDLLPDTSPPYGPIYPLAQDELRELREYLETNLRSGRIQPSKSPAGAPILFVPKKDGTLRLCVDYRGLNQVTVKNRYPLPLITEIMDRVSGSQFFSKIDVKDAYHRIRIRRGDEWKTAFRTRYGHFEYVVMPFGLTNAPATFQGYIHEALQGLLDVVCVAYLDDILIFSKDRNTHAQDLQSVLQRLREAELFAKPSKCSFFQDHVEFLGFIISRDGISMEPSRVSTI